jgi:hypothetical protein
VAVVHRPTIACPSCQRPSLSISRRSWISRPRFRWRESQPGRGDRTVRSDELDGLPRRSFGELSQLWGCASRCSAQRLVTAFPDLNTIGARSSYRLCHDQLSERFRAAVQIRVYEFARQSEGVATRALTKTAHQQTSSFGGQWRHSQRRRSRDYESVGKRKWRTANIAEVSDGRRIRAEGEIDQAVRSWKGTLFEG